MSNDMMKMVECPICKASIRPTKINKHLDSGCLNVKGPLADQVRPSHWDDFHQSSNIEFLQSIDKTPSCLFWGPPGCGKTTLARILGKSAKFLELSATTHNVADVRAAIDSAKSINSLVGQSTVIFIDEIHRFSKSQQDVLLVPVERGDIVLIAATTENPSFCVNAALLSRLRVIVLEKLDPNTIQKILWRALKIKNTPDGVIQNVIVEQLSLICDGDARTALNCLEIALGLSKNSTPVTTDMLLQILQRSHFNYDRNGDEHFNTISALHKSIRGSDANASIYWLGRMLYAGEDPIYIARRLVRFASEDIGIADSHALVISMSALEACKAIGMPECDVILGHCVTYLAQAPKSISVYKAMQKVKQVVENEPTYSVPLHLRNAPTKLMKDLEYHKGYVYPPEAGEQAALSQTYLPPECPVKQFFE